MGLKEDLVSGSSIEEDSNGGAQLVRTFYVDDVTGTATGKIIAAQDYAGIPVLGDAHPDVTTWFCNSKKTKAESTEQFKVSCYYGPTTSGTGSSVVDTGSVMELSGSSIETETNKDKDGNDMVLGTQDWWRSSSSYVSGDIVVDMAGDNRPHVYVSSGSSTTGTKPKDEPDIWTDGGLEWNVLTKSKQNVMAQKYTPVFKMKLSRTETANPVSNVSTYTGKINDAAVTIGGISWAARKLLCESILSVTNDEGSTYSVTYNFIYNRDGWDLEAIYTAEDGLPAYDYKAMDTASFNGSDTFELYEEEDFDALDLENV